MVKHFFGEGDVIFEIPISAVVLEVGVFGKVGRVDAFIAEGLANLENFIEAADNEFFEG